MTLITPMRINLTRPPRNDDELHALVKALWGIEISRAKVCPDHDAPFSWFSDSFFGRQPITLAKGSRGLSGKSYAMSALGLTQAVVWGADVNILGGSFAQSQNLHAHMKAAWEYRNAPRYMIEDDTETRMKLTNGSVIRPLTASQKTVRGPHPARLLLDEVDEIKQDIFDAAKGQPMPQDNWLGIKIPAQTAMTSTLQYADGVMINEIRRMQELGLHTHQWCVAQGSLVTTARGYVPIEEVTDSDLVLTRNGFRHVQHVTFMGYKPTIAIDAGQSRLRVTGDHQVATSRGWVRADALAAHPMSSVGADIGVIGCELVPFAAVSGAGLEQPGPGFVFGLGNDIQVLNVDARLLSAEVINSESGRDWTKHRLIDPPVSLHSGLLPVHYAVDDSVAVALSSRPYDVVSGEHGIILPVWDIGVEGDDHEFVANGILVHNCYRESLTTHGGWLDPDFVEQKKLEMPAEMWRVEYELGEPSIGTRAFDHEAIEVTFEEAEPKYLSNTKSHQEVQLLEYRTDREYVISADWAKTQDFTVITVWDVTELPMKLAYYMRINRRPYPVMIGAYNTLQQHYYAEGIHDATGLGGVVTDYITGDAWNFQMVGRQRDDMLSNYVAAVENGKVRAPQIQTLYQEHKYCSWDDLFSRSKEFHLPDTVCAAALAWKLVENRDLAAPPFALKKGEMNWMAAAVDKNTEQEKMVTSWRPEGSVKKKSEELSELNLLN